MKILFIYAFILCSCSDPRSSKATNDSDDKVDQNELEMIDTPKLIQSKSLIINDSLLDKKEYRFILNSKVRDSQLNFANRVSDEDIEVKHFDIRSDTLYCDVFFPTIDGSSYNAEVLIDKKNNIILKQGNMIKLAYGGKPAFCKLSYIILIPKKFKVNKIFFRWN